MFMHGHAIIHPSTLLLLDITLCQVSLLKTMLQYHLLHVIFLKACMESSFCKNG